MAVLLLAVWLLVMLAVLGRTGAVRTSALTALTVTVFALMLSTEAFSTVSALSFEWVTLLWATAAVAVAATQRSSIRRGVEHVRGMWPQKLDDTMDRVTVGVLAVFITGTFLAAVLYPIINYDSLAVHMPRVLMWYQNHSVAPHPAPNGSQLFSGTVVSYLVLTLKIMQSGSDRLANLVQWSSYVFSVVATSLIAKRLGAARAGQQVVALATAATSMAVLQASSTQDGLTTALWCLVAVASGLGYLSDPPATLRAALLWATTTGLALSIAVQAKASAYLVCAPFFLWFLVASVRRDGIRRVGWLAVVVLVAMLPLTGGWYARNVRLLGGDPLGSRAPGMAHILVKDFSPSSLMTNALENLSMLDGTPSGSVNRVIEEAVRTDVRVYGGRIENPATKEADSGPYHLDGRIALHDVAPAPLTVLLIVGSFLPIVLMRRDDSLGYSTWYLLAAAASSVILAALVSWNLYINRILLAPELLSIPLIGVAHTRLQGRGHRIATGVLLCVLALSVAWGAFVMAFSSTNRLITPSVLPASVRARGVGYWNTSYEDLQLRMLSPEMEREFRAIAHVLDTPDIRSVGFNDRVGFVPIYPLMTLMREHRMAYVGTTVLADKIADRGFTPDAIVELIPVEQYPAVLKDGTPRGAQLLPPLYAQDWVFLVYRAR